MGKPHIETEAIPPVLPLTVRWIEELPAVDGQAPETVDGAGQFLQLQMVDGRVGVIPPARPE